MKPISIDHANIFEHSKVVLMNIDLSYEDKKLIHKYHIENGGEYYDIDDVSMLAFIKIESDGKVSGYNYDSQSYYPEMMGEYYIENDVLPNELQQELIDFVKVNYFGNEEKYDC